MNHQDKIKFLESFGLVSRQHDLSRAKSDQKIKINFHITQRLYFKLPITLSYRLNKGCRVKSQIKRSITKDSFKLINGYECLRFLKKTEDFNKLSNQKISLRLNNMSLTDILSFKLSTQTKNFVDALKSKSNSMIKVVKEKKSANNPIQTYESIERSAEIFDLSSIANVSRLN